MDLNLKTSSTFAEITIESGNAKITEDLSTCNRLNGHWLIDEGQIEQFLSVAFKMSRFNEMSDVAFVKKIVYEFLNDSEREELIELLS